MILNEAALASTSDTIAAIESLETESSSCGSEVSLLYVVHVVLEMVWSHEFMLTHSSSHISKNIDLLCAFKNIVSLTLPLIQ